MVERAHTLRAALTGHVWWSIVLGLLVLLSVSLAPSASTAWADSASYTYDELGRLIKVTYDNGASSAYVYDAAGNRTSVVVVAVALTVFNGHVSLPGRQPPPNPALQILLQVSLLQPGTNTVLFSATPTTDSSGAFAISNVPPRPV